MRDFSMIGSKKLLAQYHGSSLSTQSCLDALARVLAADVAIARALLLTHGDRHGFYLEVEEPEPIFIRCGFASGYGGEGPAGLAIALHLLRRFQIDVDEVAVEHGLLQRLDEGNLRRADLEGIVQARVIRPMRTYGYMHAGLEGRETAEQLMRRQFPPSIPWWTLDDRLTDLALDASTNPDRAVFEAYRLLEQLVKLRCGIHMDVSGVAVLRKAFRGPGSLLTWTSVSNGEAEGRAQFFEAAFLAHRNPRAHREVEGGVARAFREFAIANELFVLESEAVARITKEDA